jgi:SAM-dependent methyltransferase
MRPGLRRVAAAAYRLVSRPPAPEEPVSLPQGDVVPAWVLHGEEQVQESAGRFIQRLPGRLDLEEKAVLDVGCGTGDLCLELARRGARSVLGVDISPERLRVAESKRQRQPDAIASALEFRCYSGEPRDLGDERFDVVVSKDSFEHYGAEPGTPSPAEMVDQMVGCLEPGGILAIGFGPLWKGPTGGHIDTWFPWAHLIFPESVVFDEFRRVRPPGKTATTFEEGVGVNRMTLARFRSVMNDPRLDCVAMETNVSENRVVRLMDRLSRIPGLAEYFTANIYGLWRANGRT